MTKVTQVIERNIADMVRKEVSSVVVAVGNRVNEEILKAIDSMLMSRVEMAVRSNTGPLGHEPKSVVHNPDQRAF